MLWPALPRFTPTTSDVITAFQRNAKCLTVKHIAIPKEGRFTLLYLAMCPGLGIALRTRRFLDVMIGYQCYGSCFRMLLGYEGNGFHYGCALS